MSKKINIAIKASMSIITPIAFAIISWIMVA